MKRFPLGIASGVGVLALGAFLMYQPVAGGASGSGGLTFTPAQEVSPSSPSAEPSSELTPKPTSTAKSYSGSAGASLQANSSQPPTISGGPRGYEDDYDVDYEDDEETGERHHRKGHHDEDEENEDGEEHWEEDYD